MKERPAPERVARARPGAELVWRPTGSSRTAATRAVILVGGIAAACGLRLAIGGAQPATSYPAAILFALVLLMLSAAAGWRWRADRHWLRAVAAGVAGAVVLIALWMSAAPHAVPVGLPAVPPLLVWTPLVGAVAVAEEVALRGVLFSALLEEGGAAVALILTSLVFGLMHVPLYGWAALPLDMAVGLLLGGLRLVTGGVAAPATAHLLADLAAGWMG